jgi:hypothetical protein
MLELLLALGIFIAGLVAVDLIFGESEDEEGC